MGTKTVNRSKASLTEFMEHMLKNVTGLSDSSHFSIVIHIFTLNKALLSKKVSLL